MRKHRLSCASTNAVHGVRVIPDANRTQQANEHVNRLSARLWSLYPAV